MNEGLRTLKQLREDEGLTLIEFGAKVGYDVSTVQGYETGKPSEKYLRKVCAAFRIPREVINVPMRYPAGAPAEALTAREESAEAPWTRSLSDEELVKHVLRNLTDVEVPLLERIHRCEDSWNALGVRARRSARSAADSARDTEHPAVEEIFSTVSERSKADNPKGKA